jgi:hypothetical protein
MHRYLSHASQLFMHMYLIHHLLHVMQELLLLQMSNLGSAYTAFLIFPSNYCPEHSPFCRSVPMWIPPWVTTHTSTSSFNFCSSCGLNSHHVATPLFFFPFFQQLWEILHDMVCIVEISTQCMGLGTNHAKWPISPQLKQVGCLPPPPPYPLPLPLPYPPL